ncbi:MAG: AAA family ATPase [Bacteroidales bacterium]|nr:AAA family ATPase [Bacteroidales bacterium]
MHKLIARKKENFILENLLVFSSVVILGPRQCGKSTIVKMLSGRLSNFMYLDLRNRQDLTILNEPELFFQSNLDKTICLDEIQLIPELISILRSEIDSNRRSGRFILIGLASRDHSMSRFTNHATERRGLH